MGLPGSYRLARRSSDFGRFPTEGAVSAKEAGDRNAERRSLAEGARKPAKQKQDPLPQNRAERGGRRYGTQQTDTGGSQPIGRGACPFGSQAGPSGHTGHGLPVGPGTPEWPRRPQP